MRDIPPSTPSGPPLSDQPDGLQQQLVGQLLSQIEPLGPQAGVSPPQAMMLANALIRDAWRHRATDIHLDPQEDGTMVRLRIDGALLPATRLTRPQAERLVNQFKTMADIDPVTLFTPRAARCTYELDDRILDLRITSAPCISGEKLAIRLLDPRRVEHRIGQLGLTDRHHELLARWLTNLNGMFLVTGPTGSGKTTTLYALLHEMKGHPRHIVTIEDPVEYQISGINQIQVDERHGLGFANGIKAMLRLDPDYLLVGEIRDSESAHVAAYASVGGRVVMSSLHSRDAASTVTALRNFGLEDHQIAVCLSVAVNQRLVRCLCTRCREPHLPDDVDLGWLQAQDAAAPDHIYRAVGCTHCHGTGYRGRTGLFEVWHLDQDDYQAILSHTDEHSIRQQLVEKEHQTLLDDALEKVAQGTTSLEEVKCLAGIEPTRYRGVETDGS